MGEKTGDPWTRFCLTSKQRQNHGYAHGKGDSGLHSATPRGEIQEGQRRVQCTSSWAGSISNLDWLYKHSFSLKKRIVISVLLTSSLKRQKKAFDPFRVVANATRGLPVPLSHPCSAWRFVKRQTLFSRTLFQISPKAIAFALSNQQWWQYRCMIHRL